MLKTKEHGIWGGMEALPSLNKELEQFRSPLEIQSRLADLMEQAIQYAEDTMGPSEIQCAWRAFRVWTEAWINPNAVDWDLFLYWYVFQWRGADPKEPSQRSEPLAKRYLNHAGPDLSSLDKTLIQSVLEIPLDFYEILPLQEPNIFYVRSMLLGYKHSFGFQELPEPLAAYNIFFGMILHTSSDVGIILAHSAPLPETAKFLVAEMRIQLVNRRKMDYLKNFSIFNSDVLNLYYDIENSQEPL